jgi:hypothetical protein
MLLAMTHHSLDRQNQARVDRDCYLRECGAIRLPKKPDRRRLDFNEDK